ncbi:hypothetical protein GLAREA_05590 [Glarea lozoyensis ATCC 20868]|uniref:Uncharacterized protein n=1 Tax=Glarea lozoyensis (strain ATCC 20868 / MF5171) TaxID=1116229 RepID=S3DCX9_GLAL2|nr:uncharacterized protein GLAREA_05590 [Glarea lozoyensis ATCC 20868]EPE36252.1 hypothetical protein GLAREA_05590 [Glarea lozoyensis ATCC 20868]
MSPTSGCHSPTFNVHTLSVSQPAQKQAARSKKQNVNAPSMHPSPSPNTLPPA